MTNFNLISTFKPTGDSVQRPDLLSAYGASQLYQTR